MGEVTQTNFDGVGDFHEKFGLDNTTHQDTGPRQLGEELLNFRIAFMDEELTEFVDSALAGDTAGMADALVDLVYVAMGTAHLMGLPWQDLWDEVQRANMEKERAATDGSNSKRGSSFDVVKPEGWRGPDIEAVLRRHGF